MHVLHECVQVALALPILAKAKDGGQLRQGIRDAAGPDPWSKVHFPSDTQGFRIAARAAPNDALLMDASGGTWSVPFLPCSSCGARSTPSPSWTVPRMPSLVDRSERDLQTLLVRGLASWRRCDGRVSCDALRPLPSRAGSIGTSPGTISKLEREVGRNPLSSVRVRSSSVEASQEERTGSRGS